MDEQLGEGNFLGLPETVDEGADVVVLSLPYELTTSYGQGTENGPKACIEASAQVETFDPLLGGDLPAGFQIFTAEAWGGDGDSLAAQLDGIEEYCRRWMDGSCFPLILGGEHGSLPAEMRALASHPFFETDSKKGLQNLTLVQIDAHADLRDELDGEPFSHACAARRALDEGVGRLLQVGVRAFSREEADFISEDERVKTWFARDLLSPCAGEIHWNGLLDELSVIEGPVWLTLDVDGLDGSLVPATGTPVPGGLAFWQAVEVIEALFAAPDAQVLGADVVEIVPGAESPLTQFTAAMLATKIVAAHLGRRIRLEVEV
uniref:Agmatinase (SpeB) n=1 Tax=uncultured marine group II/III euryarchaeote KM3_94_C01 TaxID=1456545 RepID=A0A075HWT2_9EURY|nr:agmatinase (speB) [uncultured marine group II/III euryarchaeote KM3_94_C01]